MTNNIGFTVKSIKDSSELSGHVSVEVVFNTSDKVYTYTRDVADGRNYFCIDGCKITFSRYCVSIPSQGPKVYEYDVNEIERKYKTAGEKKLGGRPAQPRKHKNKNKSVSALIKDEMQDKGLEIKKDRQEEPQELPDDEEIKEDKPAKENKKPVVHEKYDQIKMCIENGIPVYLAGPAGSGKNHTVEQIAKALNMDFYFSNSIQHEYKLTGFIDAGGQYHETEFYKACTNNKECVFFLDEIDASIPDVLVLLNAAIANGYFEFPNGRVEFDHVHFVAAGNTVGNGADELYTGRMVIDQATLDRFAIIEFDYSIAIEMHITKGNAELVNFIHQLREESEQKGIRSTFSYRCMTMVRKLESAGMELDLIIKIAVVKGLDKDTINTLRPTGDSKYHIALNKVRAAA